MFSSKPKKWILLLSLSFILILISLLPDNLFQLLLRIIIFGLGFLLIYIGLEAKKFEEGKSYPLP